MVRVHQGPCQAVLGGLADAVRAGQRKKGVRPARTNPFIFGMVGGEGIEPPAFGL